MRTSREVMTCWATLIKKALKTISEDCSKETSETGSQSSRSKLCGKSNHKSSRSSRVSPRTWLKWRWPAITRVQWVSANATLSLNNARIRVKTFQTKRKSARCWQTQGTRKEKTHLQSVKVKTKPHQKTNWVKTLKTLLLKWIKAKSKRILAYSRSQNWKSRMPWMAAFLTSVDKPCQKRSNS